MAFQFHKITGWTGLANRRDARDIGNGLSKAQNISLDVGGKIRTIGGLADFTKVDGATALTQTAKIAPGSGLFTYGSDHWRGTDTIVDVLAADNAASDEGGEVDAVGSWTKVGDGAVSSVADTDGSAIASNGTSYILKVVTATQNTYLTQSFTTVIGQKYKVHADLYSISSGSNYMIARIMDPFTDSKRQLDASWTEFEFEFIATLTTTEIRLYTTGSGVETGYFDDIYVTKIPRSDLDTDWLALQDVPNAQIDLYNINDDSFTPGLLDFGTILTYSSGAGNIDFPTTNTFTDSANALLNNNLKAGDVISISGCSTTAANNITVVLTRVAVGGATVRGNPFTVTAAEAGTVVLTTHNPAAFHYVGEALRASPIGAGIALRPKHYSFVNRIHFDAAGSSIRQFSRWFLNDVGPVAPTDVEATTANGDGAATNLTAGAGFEIGITRTADDGDWIAGVYIIACAVRYDNGQVSALFVPSTDEEFGTTILDSDSLTLTVRAKNDYDERISGGYIFCRKDESDDAWILLAEISMSEGARATLLGTYNAWAESSTADVAYTANFKSLHPNIDSYESISGIDPTTKVEVFTGDNTFWDTSVIGGNRCFIGAPRYTDAGGNLQQFRDRIMYSQVNAYDTFPVNNIIDVVKGDAEDYVKLGIYGNDLLAFKSSTLYIIDISDPDPSGWQMKQDSNKGKYPFRGVEHPGAYFETPIGSAWCNEFGVFLYNGSEIVPLLGDKIELSEHPLAYQRYMEFDGSNDYVQIADDANLQFGTSTDFSIEFWFSRLSNPSGIEIIISKRDAGDDSFEIQVQTDGTLRFYMADAVGDGDDSYFFDTTADLCDNAWHHVLFAIDRDDAGYVYVDGGADSGTGKTGTITDVDSISASGTNVRIGSKPDNTTFTFEDKIGMVRIWNSELTSANAASLAGGAPASSVGTPVAEYLPESIGDATWIDTSGNSLDGTVSGATAIYEDSWKKFYTDYSILGYHAKTNSLIIMRDCTGKWSSGQDYGDCWIIDLDTGFITTGRRVFTKGIAYSNWETDWNNDLIIAEQTNSTTVTIKKWTDEPQSQAAGLIDIRTADFDLNNPATAANFASFITWYKSSAAQTKPISYATNGNDLQTAWTRLTGNFSAIEIWKKLSLQPTPFLTDTIRFKVDNPTNSSTMELNDMTTRFDEVPGDIS